MPSRTDPGPSPLPARPRVGRLPRPGSRLPTSAAAALTVVATALLSLAACEPASSPTPADTESTLEGVRQTGWRIRADAGASLNGEVGWAAPPNVPAALRVEHPFRVRFALELTDAEPGTHRFRLEYRRNGEAWTELAAEDFPYPERATPPVSIVSPGGYPAHAVTANLLGSSRALFVSGAGIALDTLTAPWPPAGAGLPPGTTGPVHTEFEWPLVVRRFADGAVVNDDGDQFEFRMTDQAGTPIAGATYPAVSVVVPDGLLAGTFVETPERIGPWQSSDGALYFVMEPSESDNVLMVVRSTDGGATWSEVDGANRPVTGDLEGFATAFEGGRIHMLHQTSDAVFYHAFGTSDDPGGSGRWIVRDELVAAPDEPPTQVAALQARSDGTLVGIYGGPRSIHYKIRSTDGRWGTETVLDEGRAILLSGPQSALGNDDVVHLAYTGRAAMEGTIWYRRILPDGSVTQATLLGSGAGVTDEDVGAVAPLVYMPTTNTVVVLYRIDGDLFERRMVDGAPPTAAVLVSERSVVQSAVDSDQVGADAIADGETVHVLFIDEDSGAIFHTVSDRAGFWSEPRLIQGGIRALWVRGNRLTRADGTPVYGFVYDAGSFGGSGMNRYAEIVLGP